MHRDWAQTLDTTLGILHKLLNQLYLPCEISNAMTCLLKPLSDMKTLNAKASPIGPAE